MDLKQFDLKDDLKTTFYSIIKNPTRKIFAIIFAFGLWFYVSIDKNYHYAREIDILYTNLSGSLILVDSVPSIDVRFSGRGGSLLSLWAAAPEAHCNLRDSKSGKNIISVKDLTIPAGFVSIIYPTIKSIEIIIDKKVTKKMKIIVPIKGAVKEGYSISVVSLLDTVTVIGPKEIIGGLRELMTESLDVKNRTSTFKKDLKIINPSPLIRIIKENVSVEIAFETTVEKLFTNIPLKLIYSPNQKVNSEKIALDSLMVKGPKSKMGRLEKKDIEVRIKLTKLPPGDYELAAGLVLPDYIKLVYSKPRKFKVKIY